MVRAGQRSGHLLVLLRALSLTHPHARAAGKPHAARRPRPTPLRCTARAAGIATSRSYPIWRHAGLKIGSHSMTALAGPGAYVFAFRRGAMGFGVHPQRRAG